MQEHSIKKAILGFLLTLCIKWKQLLTIEEEFYAFYDASNLLELNNLSFLLLVTYIPMFTVIEFIAYLGWIKVAETLLNPWGDDDEDFQVNYVIDRNFQVITIQWS